MATDAVTGEYILPRLFFAFWPDEPLREAIVSARKRVFPLAGRPVDPANLHVTAAFLGEVRSSRLAELRALCPPLPPLTIRLDRLEHWVKPRVLVAATTRVPQELAAVVDALWARLDRLGFAREARPFRPHVTLVRDVRTVRPALPWSPLTWPVDSLRLVESVSAADGVRYVPVDD